MLMHQQIYAAERPTDFTKTQLFCNTEEILHQRTDWNGPTPETQEEKTIYLHSEDIPAEEVAKKVKTTR
jgi:hypothetical protein